jgi:RNA polymerase sigma factor (sigma-70 family)
MPQSLLKFAESGCSERTAIEAISLRFRSALVGYFQRRTRDAAEAEDLAQEVFLRILRRGNVAGLHDVRAYLFEIAASVLVDRLRRGIVRHRWDHEVLDPQAQVGEDFSSERILMGQQSLDRVAVALLELPERTRTIFMLHRLDGVRSADVAIRLGISISAVEKHMVRAVTHLTDQMTYE